MKKREHFKGSDTSFSCGLEAENQVLIFFINQHFRCLARRFRTMWGEIDLVLAKEAHLIFVEVKKRETLSKGIFCLLPRQCNRIRNAAALFLQQPQETPWETIQFDLVVVQGKRIHHLPHILSWNDSWNYGWSS